MKILIATLYLFISLPNLWAGEKNVYDFHWLDPEKVIYVLQNKVYEKEGTFYMTLGYGSQTSNDFQSSKLVQGKLGYFFHEEWGIEGVYSSISNSDSDTLTNISASSIAVPFIRRFDQYFGVMAIYSPFYAKINTFNKIFYFDMGFGLGLSFLSGESNKTAFRTENPNAPFEAEDFEALLYKVYFRFYLTESINLNFDIMRQTYSAEKVQNANENTLKSETDLILSLGISL